MPVKYFRKKTKLIFYQFLGLGLVFSILIFFLGLSAYPKMFLVWQSIKNKLSAGCGCANNFSLIHHPYIFTSLIIFGIIALAFISFLVFKILKIRKATRDFVNLNLKSSKSGLTPKLRKIARINGLEKRILELDLVEPVVFCYGFFRPRICISAKIVKNLSKAELTAVIRHEQHHLSVYEPIKLFLVKIFARILFFIPNIKSVSNKYLVFSELAADELATDGFKNKLPLSRALYKIIKWQEQTIIGKNLAISFFGSVLTERINKLTSDEYKPTGVFTKRLLINVLTSFVLLFSLNAFLFSHDQSASFSNSTCLANDSTASACQMIDNNNCKMPEASTTHFCQAE